MFAAEATFAWALPAVPFCVAILRTDPLVRGMLIHQNEAVRIFHQDIQLAEHADDLELLTRFCNGLLWL
jgi:hypothetical protein